MAQKISRRSIAESVTDQLLAPGADSKAIMRRLAAYLVDHHLTQFADAILNTIAEAIFARSGRLAVEVTSARELASPTRAELLDYLKAQTGAQSIDLQATVSPSLIGGFIVRTPSAELDLSIQTKLKQLTAIS